MDPRRLFSALALWALLLGTIPAGWAQAKKPTLQKPEFTIIQLRFLQAEEAQSVLTKVLGLEPGKGPTRIVAEPRTNTLIVSATPTELRTMEAVLKRLDAPAEDPIPRRMMKVFPLRNVPADKELLATLQVILPPDARIAADPRTNAVIVQADEATHEAVARLLDVLDRGERIALGGPGAFQVRIVWLASGKAPAGASPPPEDFAEVVARLEKIGVKDPKMLAQFMVPAERNGKFAVRGVTKRDEVWSLSAEGHLTDKDGQLGLAIQLQATAAEPGPSPRVLCDLETTLTFTPGQPQTVLLGVTPTEARTSVFALQLIPEGTKGKGRR